MKIKKLILENFRGYKAKTEFSFERDITTIIGENDVGKSTKLSIYRDFLTFSFVCFMLCYWLRFIDNNKLDF